MGRRFNPFDPFGEADASPLRRRFDTIPAPRLDHGLDTPWASYPGKPKPFDISTYFRPEPRCPDLNQNWDKNGYLTPARPDLPKEMNLPLPSMPKLRH